MRDWCWLHVFRLHPCSGEAPEQRGYVQRDDHVHCVVVASHYSENALHRYSGPNKSSEPSLDSGSHHVGIGCVAQAAEGGGHRHQNVPREGQIPAVVRPRLPVTHAGKRDPEQYVTCSLGLVFDNVSVAWKTVFRRAWESGGYICKETKSIAHGYHHAPSPQDVHRVGGGRTGATRHERHDTRAYQD
jgi:hypothetical protein